MSHLCACRQVWIRFRKILRKQVALEVTYGSGQMQVRGTMFKTFNLIQLSLQRSNYYLPSNGSCLFPFKAVLTCFWKPNLYFLRFTPSHTADCHVCRYVSRSLYTESFCLNKLRLLTNSVFVLFQHHTTGIFQLNWWTELSFLEKNKDSKSLQITVPSGRGPETVPYLK